MVVAAQQQPPSRSRRSLHRGPDRPGDPSARYGAPRATCRTSFPAARSRPKGGTDGEPGGPPSSRQPPDGGAPTAFVGRREELSLLDHCPAEALAGTPRVVVIQGDPGVGKPRLVDEFLAARAVRASRAHLLVGRCDPGLRMPYPRCARHWAVSPPTRTRGRRPRHARRAARGREVAARCPGQRDSTWRPRNA